MRGRFGDEVMKGFVTKLRPLYALAEQTPGFVWRLPDGHGYRVGMEYFGDPQIILNMSVWKTIDSLRTYTYESSHADMLGPRNSWFEELPYAHSVLWWIASDQTPSIADAAERLTLLRENGPSPQAFTFEEPFPAPGI